MKTKGTITTLGTLLLLILFVGSAMAGPPEKCATIKDGTITDSAGNPVALGFDEFCEVV